MQATHSYVYLRFVTKLSGLLWPLTRASRHIGGRGRAGAHWGQEQGRGTLGAGAGQGHIEGSSGAELHQTKLRCSAHLLFCSQSFLLFAHGLDGSAASKETLPCMPVNKPIQHTSCNGHAHARSRARSGTAIQRSDSADSPPGAASPLVMLAHLRMQGNGFSERASTAQPWCAASWLECMRGNGRYQPKMTWLDCVVHCTHSLLCLQLLGSQKGEARACTKGFVHKRQLQPTQPYL